MINFRTGSQLHRLITLLSVAGEYPTKSLYLLGNERAYKELVSHLIEQQTIRNPNTEKSITPMKVVNISGKGRSKKVRLYRGALPILEWINAHEYYAKTFRSHSFPGDAKHIERDFRVAESLAMFMGADYEFREYKLPPLKKSGRYQIELAHPSFYTARYLKQVNQPEANGNRDEAKKKQAENKKALFTRIVGVAIAGNTCYAVYNTRNAVMKWCGKGECKAKHEVIDVVRVNTNIDDMDSAILFGASAKTAIATLEETERNNKLELRLDGIYDCVHYVPLDENGMWQLRIMALPDWKEILLDLLFEPEERSYNRGLFEYDAFVNGVYVFSHLDCDLGRLRRFKKAVESGNNKYEVLCYEDQVSYITDYLDGLVEIRVLKRADVEAELNLKRRNIFEED